jgi:hypothetical protein
VRRDSLSDMDKSAIDVAKALVRLSELTIFELRGEWRRRLLPVCCLHHLFDAGPLGLTQQV